jgi:RNA polymerase sigma-70 factor (ECF subfamily)
VSIVFFKFILVYFSFHILYDRGKSIDGGESVDKQQEFELIREFRRGNIQAFEALILDYEKSVYGICFRMLRDREEAYDLSQEVFIKAYKGLSSFQFQSKFSTWIYRIATNACLDYLKKKRVDVAFSLNQTVGDDEFTPEMEDETAPEPQAELERKEVREQIEEAIGQLSEKYREAIILRELEGLSYEEIADITESSLGATKTRIKRGRERLREILEEMKLRATEIVYENRKG